MDEHKHRYVMHREGPVTEMICECGVSIRSILRGITLVEDETVDD